MLFSQSISPHLFSSFPCHSLSKVLKISVCRSPSLSLFLLGFFSPPSQVTQPFLNELCVCIAMMWFFILDWVPATTGSSAVFTIRLIPPPLVPSLLLSHPFFFSSSPILPHNILKGIRQTPNSCRISKTLLKEAPLFHLQSDLLFCLSLFLANEEGARGCHGNSEEAQWHGPQHCGCQGRKHHLKVFVNEVSIPAGLIFPLVLRRCYIFSEIK